PSSISALCDSVRPAHNECRAGVECGPVVLTATLVELIDEPDRDIHLVLVDGKESMIAEIPKPVGSYGWMFRAARATAKRLPLPCRVRVSGMPFFDKKHNVGGHARNWIEIHPVLSIEQL